MYVHIKPSLLRRTMKASGIQRSIKKLALIVISARRCVPQTKKIWRNYETQNTYKVTRRDSTNRSKPFLLLVQEPKRRVVCRSWPPRRWQLLLARHTPHSTIRLLSQWRWRESRLCRGWSWQSRRSSFEGSADQRQTNFRNPSRLYSHVSLDWSRGELIFIGYADKCIPHLWQRQS